MPQINPNILTWARETAGLTLAQAAKKVGINDARGVAGEDRLQALEGGKGEPTEAQLRNMAKAYRRPLLSFYLEEIPKTSKKGEDYRTLPERADPTNVYLDALLRNIQVSQSLTKDVVEDETEGRRLPFVGSMTVRDDSKRVADAIGQTIGVTRSDYRRQRNSEAAFSYLRDGAERAGIFVILAGNLGSPQTAIDVETFRGFALADPIAPFVVINDQDAKTAWSFTLLHELAHIWIGASGVSGAEPAVAIERYCNEVASEFLLGKEELQSLPLSTTGLQSVVADIASFARERHVSGSMVAYNLFRMGRLSDEVWRAVAGELRDHWRRSKAAEREAAKSKEGGPNYYTVRRHRVGTALLTLVRRAIDEGNLTPVKAGKVLGVKPMNVYPLVAATPAVREF
jgi:Zn-dependent peptidase ImmA (M78 family)/transcriptional regulator with XRE-family HTH domain